MGKHFHKHEHCKHQVEYCPICDVCYCTLCGKEWGQPRYYYWRYSTPFYYRDNSTPEWSYTDDPNSTGVVKCSHTRGRHIPGSYKLDP